MWSEVKIFGGTCALSWTYSYVICMSITVRHVLLLSYCYLLYVFVLFVML
jgi:hypothetical protein